MFSKVSVEPGLDGLTRLDMAPNSVDDMFEGCKDQMKTVVHDEYLPNEKNANSKFRQAWNEAEEIYNANWKRNTTMGKEQFVAVYLYSFGRTDISNDINTAVKTQQSNYTTNFGYHTINFFLTDAVQSLNAQETDKERCFISYHRVDEYFSLNVLGKKIRFGSFTSATLRAYLRNNRRGNKSCFKISTCFGADISKFGKREAEALIPPYEVFNVTQVKRRCDEPRLECEVVYELKSTHTLSNLNCALFPN